MDIPRSQYSGQLRQMDGRFERLRQYSGALSHNKVTKYLKESKARNYFSKTLQCW